MTIKQKYYGGTTDDTFRSHKGIIRTREIVVSSGPKTSLNESNQSEVDPWKEGDGIRLNSLSKGI